jgi:CubicO group peptidase (beta-lactamase class C family)
MPDFPRALQSAIDSAHTPAVSYAYIEPDTQYPGKFVSTSIALGKKSVQSTATVDNNTRFPASSLSKIVFTYLVLQLAKAQQIDLDEPLLPILLREGQQYERFKVNGQYPTKTTQLTARDVLSHTTGLPNFVGPELSPTLKFNESPLGSKYLYSGEGFLFLQTVLEAKMRNNLQALAKEYVFDPLEMDRSTFSPQPDGTNTVMVHTELGKPIPIVVSNPPLNAAGSLLTTANDFSKFMNAWLEQMDDPIIKQAFEFETSLALSRLTPEEFRLLSIDDHTKKYLKTATDSNYSRAPFNQTEFDELKRAIDESTQTEIKNLSKKLVFEPRAYKTSETCGLGWHIYKNNDEVIAYQYGENTNTRSFMAIDVTNKKGAVFFTNSENGMSIANQVFNSSDLPPISDLQEIYKEKNYSQSDEPGWKETIAGKIYEDKGNFARAHGNFIEAESQFAEARRCFVDALDLAPNDVSKQQRLEWFDKVHQLSPPAFTQPLKTFEGRYTNDYGDEVEISTRDGVLIFKQSGQEEVRLIRVSETDFLPGKDQSFKINFNGDPITIDYVHGGRPKYLKVDHEKIEQEPNLHGESKSSVATAPYATAAQAHEKKDSTASILESLGHRAAISRVAIHEKPIMSDKSKQSPILNDAKVTKAAEKEPGYRASTISSRAKEREKYIPLTTPKLPGKP